MNLDNSDDAAIDAAVARANRFPRRTVDQLPLDEVSADLMGDIMNGQKDTLADEPTRGRRPWFVPLVAAAAVATLVGGGVALRDLGASPGGQEGAPASSTAPEDSLPPTAENLRQVIVDSDGWAVGNLDDSGRWGGSLAWEKGDASVEVRWLPKDDHAARLKEGATVAPGEDVSLLGQDGTSFTYPDEDMGDPTEGGGANQPTPKKIDKGQQGLQKSPAGRDREPLTAPEGGDELFRVTTVLPPVGDQFLELDIMVADEATYDDVVDSLIRVEESEWFDAMGDGVVSPDDGDAFLDEAGRDVPMPDGLEVSPENLNLPQSTYQARGTFAGLVLCGWAEKYVAGDESALTVLQESRDWPVLQAMQGEGGLPGAVRMAVRDLERDGRMVDFRQVVGC